MALTDARSASDVAGDGGGGGDEKDCTGGPGVWVGAIVGGGAVLGAIYLAMPFGGAVIRISPSFAAAALALSRFFKPGRLILKRFQEAPPFEMVTRSWPRCPSFSSANNPARGCTPLHHLQQWTAVSPKYADQMPLWLRTT